MKTFFQWVEAQTPINPYGTPLNPATQKTILSNLWNNNNNPQIRNALFQLYSYIPDNNTKNSLAQTLGLPALTTQQVQQPNQPVQPKT